MLSERSETSNSPAWAFIASGVLLNTVTPSRMNPTNMASWKTIHSNPHAISEDRMIVSNAICWWEEEIKKERENGYDGEVIRSQGGALRTMCAKLRVEQWELCRVRVVEFAEIFVVRDVPDNIEDVHDTDK